MTHSPTDRDPNPDLSPLQRLSADEVEEIVSPPDQAPGHAYVQTADGVETVTLDDPHIEHACRCIHQHARQDVNGVTMCLATAREARHLRDALAMRRCFTAIPIRIYDADGNESRRLTTDTGQRWSTTPAEYATALEAFLDTFTVETDDGSIPVRDLEARFRTWYRNLTATNGLDRVWFGRLLAAQTTLERTGDGRVVPDRHWIDWE